MSTVSVSPLEAFQWTPQPRAQALVDRLIADFQTHNAAGPLLAKLMIEETGTRFGDWVDSIILPRKNGAILGEIESVGFQRQGEDDQRPIVFAHPGGMFPRLVVEDVPITRLLIKADSVADFAAANIWCEGELQGEPFAPLRMCVAVREGDYELVIVERHGYRGYELDEHGDSSAGAAMQALESFRRRKRDFDEDEAGFAEVHRLVDQAISKLGVDRACDLFFQSEREYWQRRNRAAQVQKFRQDRLGLGWANHDHHTYRSSRQHFTKLVSLWEKLGFTIRERFYAGREAGWGAQVMEQPVCGITTFNDVDLSPDELFNDFAHEPLAPRETLGTVGLWCGLHGDSLLQAGMHHLEAQFDFDELRDQLESTANVRVMKPFTEFPYLRQAFTEGERWPVAEKRIARLLSQHLITEQQAEQFRERGAIGSHLENLERNDGFKGFNQEGVSEIIAATDPRKQRFLMSGA